jgi:hypothetical protein
MIPPMNPLGGKTNGVTLGEHFVLVRAVKLRSFAHLRFLRLVISAVGFALAGIGARVLVGPAPELSHTKSETHLCPAE